MPALVAGLLSPLVNCTVSGPPSPTQTANTALCYAAMHGHVDVLKFLLAQGAAVNAPNRDRATALHRCALANQAVPAAMLLNAGASVKLRDKYGRTPLMYAAMNGSAECAHLLLARGASRSDRDEVRGARACPVVLFPLPASRPCAHGLPPALPMRSLCAGRHECPRLGTVARQ